jgi:hypothetical protein
VLLLSPDMSEWLPAGHLARFVIETVDQLDLAGIYGYYRQDGHGRPAHDRLSSTGRRNAVWPVTLKVRRDGWAWVGDAAVVVEARP